MRIETLNGMTAANGLSRVNPVNGLSRVNLNGLSRVNLNASYTLNNGYTLNGYELNAYLEECAIYGEYPTMNGLKDWAKKRREKKAARQQRKEERRVGRTQERAARRSRREERHERRGEFFRNIGEAAREAAAGIGGGLADLDLAEMGGQLLPDEFDQFIDISGDMPADEKGLFGPPKFNPFSGKWWGSSKVPVIQKIGVGAVGLVGIDALTGGNIILQRAGIMKKKKK